MATVPNISAASVASRIKSDIRADDTQPLKPMLHNMIDAIYATCVHGTTIARQNYMYLATLVHLLTLADIPHLDSMRDPRQNQVTTTDGTGYITKVYATSDHQIHFSVQLAKRAGVFVARVSALPMTFLSRGKATFALTDLHMGDPSIRMSVLTVMDGVVMRPLARRTYQEKMALFMHNLATPSQFRRRSTSTEAMESAEVMMVMSHAAVGDGIIVRTGPGIQRIIDERLCDRVRTLGAVHLPEGRSLYQGVIKKLTVTPHRFDVVVAWQGGPEEDVFWMSSNGANPVLRAHGMANPVIGIDSRGLYTKHTEILAETLASCHNCDSNVIDLVNGYLSSWNQEKGMSLVDLSKRRRRE